MKKFNFRKTSFKILRLVPVLGAAALLLSLGARPASAQSLALAPAQLKYTFKPGQPFQFELNVANNGNTPVEMEVNVTDLWYNAKNEKLFNPPGSSPRSAANWIEFVPRQFSAPAHGTGHVKVVVTPPLEASGGYYAVIFVQSKPQLVSAATAEKQAIYANIRLGSLLLLNAENTDDYKVDLSDFRFTPPAPDQAMKLDFLLSNQSNTHVFPETRVAILDASHNLIAKTDGEIKRFLPQQTDRVSVGWAGTLPPGSYSAILTVLYGQDKVLTREFPFVVPVVQ
jgi:hypothetical protein